MVEIFSKSGDPDLALHCLSVTLHGSLDKCVRIKMFARF